MHNKKNLLKTLLQYIPLLILLLIVFMTYANMVDDLDFWWHLKSGQLIFEAQGLPQEDYFAYTTDIPERISVIGRNEVAPSELPKEKIDDEIIDECKQGIKNTPATKGYYETLGYMYMKKNRLEDALNIFQKYLTIDPHDEKVKYYHDLVKEYMKRHK